MHLTVILSVTAGQQETSESDRRPRASWRYDVGLLLTGGVLVIGLLFSGQTDWFLRHSGYSGLRGVGYSQRVIGQNCQVLIYGDSSAMAELDPKVIQKVTGLSTCNVSEGTSIQRVVGTDTPLQAYLSKNAPPMVLLTTWTPSFFKPDQAPLDEFHVEGMWYAWRYRVWTTLLTWRMAGWTASYVTWELRALLQNIVATGRPDTFDARLAREEAQGQMGWTSPPETHCVRDYDAGAVKRFEGSALAFRKKYTTAETRVIVDISPIPACDPLYDVYLRQDAGLYDNQLDRLPIGDFNNGDVHLDPEGSRIESIKAAQQVMALLKR